MTLAITPLYAGLLTLLYLLLSVRVIRQRKNQQTALGPGEGELLRRVRVHGNFAEYTPLALLLLGFAETQGTAGWAIHLLCAALLSGRCIHAFGVSQEKEDFRLRVAGMACTFTVLGVTALILIVHGL